MARTAVFCLIYHSPNLLSFKTNSPVALLNPSIVVVSDIVVTGRLVVTESTPVKNR